MERNLLFINKYPEIIEEFTREMRDKGIAIDIADNGVDAAILLRKKEYQIVITGISLDGFNGEQIVTYVNKTYPNTVCILYTTTISTAQLHFFMNERDVFKVFLRPVNFRQEFFQALEEAFEYHELQKSNDAERKEQQKRLLGNKDAIDELTTSLLRQQEGWERLAHFSTQVIDCMAEDMTESGLLELEQQLIKKGCKHHKQEELEQLREAIKNL